MLQGPAITPAEAIDWDAGHRCPECGAAFVPKHPSQIFCTPPHGAAWHNRWTVRGRVLTPLAAADRATRGGSRGDVETGIRARRDMQRLLDRWAVEDRAESRMPIVKYVRLRRAKGFELA